MPKYYICYLLFIAPLTLFSQQATKDKIDEYYNNIDLDKIDSIALSLELKNINKIKLITNFKVNKKGKLVDIHVVALNNSENVYSIHEKANGSLILLEKEMINYLKGLKKIPPHIVDGKPQEKQYMFMIIVDLKTAKKKERKRIFELKK